MQYTDFDIDAFVTRRLRIDTRALAAFRILVGSILLLDLALRAPDIVAFYTDRGVLPRSIHADAFPVFHAASIHAVGGSATFQAGLFLVAGAFALALTVGYRTRIATIASWYLSASLQARNPLVLTAGDQMLLVLLFFGIFLPLGARYSIDAVRHGSKTGSVTGITAEAPLLYTTGMVYVVNAVTRLRSDAWVDGRAVPRVFELDGLTGLLGEWLAHVPGLLVALNWFWMGLLVAAPLLLFLTGRARSLLVVLFVGAHLGMLLTLYLVVFPLVNVAALVLFLPPAFWNGVEERLHVRLPFETGWAETHLWLDDEPSVPSGVQSALRRTGNVVVAIALLLGFVWASAAVGPARIVGGDTGDSTVDWPDYPWSVFSPEPLSVDGWYVAPARLESGRRVDAYRLSAVDWDRPPDLDDEYPRPAWGHYLLSNPNRVHSADRHVRAGFARYLCDRTASHYDQSVETVTVYFMRDDVRSDRIERTRVIRHTCDTVGHKS